MVESMQCQYDEDVRLLKSCRVLRDVDVFSSNIPFSLLKYHQRQFPRYSLISFHLGHSLQLKESGVEFLDRSIRLESLQAFLIAHSS